MAGQNIRYKDRLDLLIMEFDIGCSVAGVFTTSTTSSAAVKHCRLQLQKHDVQQKTCLLVHAGNSIAFTGDAGVEATKVLMAKLSAITAAKNNYFCATGVVGEPLDHQLVSSKLPQVINHKADFSDAAKAIITTDTFLKMATLQITTEAGQSVTINGFAKGSGMIHPNMATMLAYIVTDAKVDQSQLQKILNKSTYNSFNSITVDSDTSTSDSLMLFATGKVELNANDITEFAQAINDISINLAQQIVKDGEGASKFITINVNGCETIADAHKLAMTIANSPLVKTAIAGEDANWGRIAMAMGKSGVIIDESKVDIAMGGIIIAQNGQQVADYDETPVTEHLKTSEIVIDIDIKQGRAGHSVWTCDLTHGYITINADYRS
jgi:glutamate N-acetyltransferase/amino-acid N-acetyltransferase